MLGKQAGLDRHCLARTISRLPVGEQQEIERVSVQAYLSSTKAGLSVCC